MNDTDVAGRLAEALADWGNLPPIARMASGQRAAIVAALLPVVRKIADQRAAEEVARIADRIREGYPLVVGNLSIELDRIDARVAALRGEAGR